MKPNFTFPPFSSAPRCVQGEGAMIPKFLKNNLHLTHNFKGKLKLMLLLFRNKGTLQTFTHTGLETTSLIVYT